MNRKSTKKVCAALVTAGLLGLQGCVSVAPLEPIKNPPTHFRSDSTVAVEFLAPAAVGLRCGERGTAFYGMPVFHAMACGNGRLITMPDACATFTGGAYAGIVCDTRERARDVQSTFRGLLVTASFSGASRPRVRTEEKALGEGASITVEFVHPSSVAQRCLVLGADLVRGEGLYACALSDLMVLPNPCMSLEGGWYARTLCHEMGHANGWAMDHPGGSFLSDRRAGIDPNAVPPPRAIMAGLESGAPLRKASESPVYLAYAAEKQAASLQTAALPAPPLDAAPAQASMPAVLPASLRRLQATLPVMLADLQGLAGAVRVPAVRSPLLLAGLVLRPPAEAPGPAAQPSRALAVLSVDQAGPPALHPSVTHAAPVAGLSAGEEGGEGDTGQSLPASAATQRASLPGATPETSGLAPSADQGPEPAPRAQQALHAPGLRPRDGQPETLSPAVETQESAEPVSPAPEPQASGPEAPGRKPLRPFLRPEEYPASAASV